VTEEREQKLRALVLAGTEAWPGIALAKDRFRRFL
jgi:hypothetical protein